MSLSEPLEQDDRQPTLTQRIAAWDALPFERQQQFLIWVEAEIERLNRGGEVPDCFDGSPAQMVGSLIRERDEYLKYGKARYVGGEY